MSRNFQSKSSIVVAFTILLLVLTSLVWWIYTRADDFSEAASISSSSRSAAKNAAVEEETIVPQADESTPPVANSGVQTDHQKLTFGQRVRSAMPSWEKVDHPYQKYEENINAAIAGEADSQFIVAQSLELCLYETSLTPESRKECSALRARIGEIRVDEAVSWYEAAAESNYALAVLKVRALDEFGVEERTRILVDALSTKNPAVFDVLATYFSARQLSGDTEFIAWNYYSCYYSQRCDEGNFLNNLLIGGFEHELNMVVERIEEIGSSIRNENWAALVPDY